MSRRSLRTTTAEVAKGAGGWTLLSNHGHVLVCIARDSEARVRDIAAQVEITERAVQRILGELEAAGMVRRERVGRRNRYVIDGTRALRHPLESECTVAELLEAVGGGRGRPRARAGRTGRSTPRCDP